MFLINLIKWLLLRFVANYMKKNLIKGNIIQLSSIYGMVAQDKNI